jgi:hypothetical protein
LSSVLSAFVNPPARLRAISDRWAWWARVCWLVAFGLSVLTVLVSTIYVLRASYELQPTFESVGLDFDVVTDDGQVVIGTAGPADKPGRIPITSTLVAVDGKQVSPKAPFADIAELLKAAPGPIVAVTLRQPDGSLRLLRQERHEATRTPAQVQDRNLRIGARIGAGLLACGVLLLCS